jgi:hypothetical protein
MKDIFEKKKKKKKKTVSRSGEDVSRVLLGRANFGRAHMARAVPRGPPTRSGNNGRERFQSVSVASSIPVWSDRRLGCRNGPRTTRAARSRSNRIMVRSGSIAAGTRSSSATLNARPDAGPHSIRV